MASKLDIPVPVRRHIRTFGLGRTDGLKLFAKLHRQLPPLADELQLHSSTPGGRADRFNYVVFLPRDGGSPIRVGCRVQKVDQDIVRLLAAFLID